MDDIDAILTAEHQVAVTGQESRAIVELPILQAVHGVVAGHVEFPLSPIVLGNLDMCHDELRYEPDGLCLVLDHRASHCALRAIQVIDRLHLSTIRVVHGDTRRRCHPDDSTAVHDDIIDGRTRKRPSTTCRIVIGKLVGIHIDGREVLRMAYQDVAIRHGVQRTYIVSWNFRVRDVDGLECLLLGVHELQATAKGAYHKSVMLVLAQGPDALMSQPMRRLIVSFPLSIAVTSQSTVEGTKEHGSILHGHATHYDVGLQARLRHAVMGLRTCDRIIADDACIIRTTPIVAPLVLSYRTNIPQVDGREFGGRRRIIGDAILIRTYPNGTAPVDIDFLKAIVHQTVRLVSLHILLAGFLVVVQDEEPLVVGGNP